jgi:hypothetical protein
MNISTLAKGGQNLGCLALNDWAFFRKKTAVQQRSIERFARGTHPLKGNQGTSM